MKKIISLLAFLLVLMLLLPSAIAEPRTTAPREDALTGESITPADFPASFLPGLDKIGAIPAKKYVVAISNGDMANEWRRSFWEDMENFGKLYAERFGIEILAANSGANSTKQIQDVQALLAQSPDILLMAPNEAAPLSVVADLCEQAGVPLITVDRMIDRKPGEGAFVSAIMIDGYLNGVANGISIVEKLTEKNGAPKGNIAEIAGVLGSNVSIERSMGIRRVLSEYPDIKVVTVRNGEFDRDASYKAAQDILTVNPKGTLDGIVGACDTSSIAAIEACKAAGRTELLGYIWGVDGLVEALDAIVAGEMVETNECPPYFGMTAFEYAIQYLNGETIPNRIPVPQRDFRADTPEMKAELERIIAECKAAGNLFVPSSRGGYSVMVPNAEVLARFYPKPYWEQPESYYTEFKPYTETK
jgi:ABC-type sugar transport system substrate-binding protein